jgi:hypothetical protein
MQIPDHLKNKRLHRGNLGSVEQDEFCDIIVSFVSLAGGAIRRQKIIEKIHSVFSAQFSPEDYALLESQKPPKERWIHNVDWAKRKLVQQGILLPPPGLPTGTWKLSDEGIRRAERLIKNQ